MYSAFVYLLVGNNVKEDKTVLVAAKNLEEANNMVNFYKSKYKNIILDNTFNIDKMLF